MIESYLRRYTELPALVHLLTERKITLLDPQSWDDTNDSHYLALYREKKKLKSVLALCFTQADEAYHHWRVFAPGAGGVCIKFKHSALVKAVKKSPDVRMEPVQYLTLSQNRRENKLKIEDLPFLKRYAFQHESEFRLLYESTAKNVSTLDIDIPLTAIDRITLSPWLHSALAPHLKQLLKSIDRCSGLEIVRSTLISNDVWKRRGEAAT